MYPVSPENNSSRDAALRVVAIDDDEQHLKFVATLLSQDNVVVFTSSDSQTGLSLVHAKHSRMLFSTNANFRRWSDAVPPYSRRSAGYGVLRNCATFQNRAD